MAAAFLAKEARCGYARASSGIRARFHMQKKGRGLVFPFLYPSGALPVVGHGHSPMGGFFSF